MKPHPIEFEVFKNLFLSIAEEMGVTLCRTGFSPNIKERLDYSCAVYDADGETIAQGDHMPVHLGAMPLSVRAAIDAGPMEPGDIVMLNDPFHGGTHLPDITLVSPVFLPKDRKPTFFVANRAHHSDVGGMSPGSMPVAREIYQEGLILPPVKLATRGRINQDVRAILLANVRTPDERDGDLTAQVAANRVGDARLRDAVSRYGRRRTLDYASALQDYTARVLRAAIRQIPDGAYAFEDEMDDDGFGSGGIRIRAVVTIKGDRATIDFTGSDPQVSGPVNANYAMTLSACLYSFRCLVGDDVLYNAGVSRPLTVIAPEGSIVNAQRPAAVAGGNVETSQRITDVVLGALGRALPDRLPAASQGTMNNVTLGGLDPRTGRRFAYYETLGGGMGARKGLDGLSGVHTHMSNTRNTPVEAIEHYLPVRIREYSIRRDSGGGGAWRGGDGLVREYEMLTDTGVTVIAERRRGRPYGAAGGDPGKSGTNTLIRDGQSKALPGKVELQLRAGDRLRIETPGGGGYGKALMFSFWFEADRQARRALVAASIGWMLDAFDVMLYALVLKAVRADLHLSADVAGGLQSLTLIASAIGGLGFGVLADRWGRTRALMLSVLIYLVFTAACGFAQTALQLAVFRLGLGFGMGGEWASGAALVSETWPTRHRGKALGLMQSSWAIGYGLAAVVNYLVQDVAGLDWRAVFFAGVLPALFALWVRSRVEEPKAWREARAKGASPSIAKALSAPGVGITAAVTLMNACMFAWWGFNLWVPSYLQSPAVGLSNARMNGFIVVMQTGMWLGYVTFGFIADAIGRKRAYVACLIVAAASVLAYASTSNPSVLLVLGPITAFFATGFFSGFGAVTAELYPTAVRATAQGFTYNVGRIASAAAPWLVGGLTETHGFPAALSLTAAGYALAAVFWIFIPETAGREFSDQRVICVTTPIR